jgi:hypothetical protein
VRRYIQQASGFFLKADAGLADESARLATDASAGVAASAPMYADVEARLLQPGKMEGIALRYGVFYGPNTWYGPEGAATDHVRRREMPGVGQGEGVWSFVHIADAALASVAALTAPPGMYNVVDDDPSPVSRWLPAFARWVGAPPPPQLTEQEAREVAGEDAVSYGTTLSGASNEGETNVRLHAPPFSMAEPVRSTPHEPALAKPCGLWALATTITTRDRGEQ